MSRAIELRKVNKTFGGYHAVRNLSITVARGEFLVLLGPSGCGKSTVLRLIAGLEDITDGELFLAGDLANHMTPSERDMAMVFQNFALYPSMTARENIRFPLRLQDPRGDADPAVTATAHMLAIEDLLDRRPGQLSGGERQRVAMGRAISRRPSVFLMDEPLSSLDAKLRGQLRAEIARLTKDLGVTTVYVTHDQAEAMSLGDRVAVMRDGVLQQVSSPRDLYARPANVFVAAFVGTPRINLLEGVVLAPLDGPMTLELGRQRLVFPEPLSVDHQLLRIQQGRRVIVGRARTLRAPGIRRAPLCPSAPPRTAAPGCAVPCGQPRNLNTGSRPALVPDLEASRSAPDRRSSTKSRRRGGGRMADRLTALLHGQAAVSRGEGLGSGKPTALHERRTTMAGDLVLRTGPREHARVGARVSLMVDLRQLYVFDHAGSRICPTPDAPPGLDP